MIKITAVVLTYNEEKRIGNVLESLSKFDDIIVFDKSSVDRTREIASERGTKIYQTEYYNDTTPVEVNKRFAEALDEIQENDWIFSATASDIIHYGLYMEMKKCLEKIEDQYDVIEIPIYRYSMGAIGKHSYYGDLRYQIQLYSKSYYQSMLQKSSVIHEKSCSNARIYRLVCSNPQVAVYHLTHENLELVMDRHWRYAIQYVIDWESSGRSREKIMSYAWHEIVRTVITYFSKRMYKNGEVGLAQCMMMIMYNSMIYLNAFFSKEKENEITLKYNEIRKSCIEGE